MKIKHAALFILIMITFMSPFCLFSLAVDVDKTLGEVKNLENSGKYSEAMSLLSRALREADENANNAGNKNHKVRIIIALGDFYRDVCGDMRKAKTTYKRAINTAEPGDNRFRPEAETKIAAILELENKYEFENRELRTLVQSANRKHNKKLLRQNIERLNRFTKNKKDYYLLHEVYYALALHYESLEQPGMVYDSLERATALKPGIIFYLPVKYRSEQAYDAWLRNTVDLTVRIVLIVLLAGALLLFYLSRPWQWLKPRYFLLLVLLLASWFVFFHAAHAVTGFIYDISDSYTPEPGKDIEFRSAAPGSPGSSVVAPLFYYGLMAVGALFVFTLGMRRCVLTEKSKKMKRMKRMNRTVMAAGCIYGFLLFSAFSLLFYMRHCLNAGQFKEPGTGVFYHISGQLHFNTEEPEPYVLTNPRAYPGLNPANIEDPYLRKWVEAHVVKGGKEEGEKVKR